MSECILGPTLLDMTKLYETDVKVITIVILLRGIGSIIGAMLGIINTNFNLVTYLQLHNIPTYSWHSLGQISSLEILHSFWLHLVNGHNSGHSSPFEPFMVVFCHRNGK